MAHPTDATAATIRTLAHESIRRVSFDVPGDTFMEPNAERAAVAATQTSLTLAGGKAL